MANKSDLDLVSELSDSERAVGEFRLDSISPDDGKYGEAMDSLRDYITPRAEWFECARIQKILLETRMEFGQATQENVREAEEALKNISLLNMNLLEKKVTRHDQLAVIEEMPSHWLVCPILQKDLSISCK